jgi:predicted dithiol-disulfide oxidoreductase (DUF899 family)
VRMRQTRLANESAEYLAAREELRGAEIELMRQRERVAELRRSLPPGPVVPDFTFSEGPTDLDDGDAPLQTVRLSELFTAPNRSLVIYHLMFGKQQTSPCPMCTMWVDGYTSHAQMADDIHERGIDLLSPVWNVLDLTPQGRADWYVELEYGQRPG